MHLVVCAGLDITRQCLTSPHEADAQSCIIKTRCASTRVSARLQRRSASRLARDIEELPDIQAESIHVTRCLRSSRFVSAPVLLVLSMSVLITVLFQQPST